jgi:hypothetical protein
MRYTTGNYSVFIVNAFMAVGIEFFDSSLCPRYLLTEVRIHHLLYILLYWIMSNFVHLCYV